jgi:hypothetical protein
MSTPEIPECPGSENPKGSIDAVVREVPFLCVACGVVGSVTNPPPLDHVTCPGCDSEYVHWPDGHWRCVVEAVFRSTTISRDADANPPNAQGQPRGANFQ